MSKGSYNDIDELFEDLINDIEGGIVEEVSKEMKKIEQESIDENVYNVFAPKEYDRRKDGGGLRSEGNMETIVTKTGDGITIEIHNSTTGNSSYRNYWQGEIQDFIETGNYLWNCGCQPRPFIEDTQEKVDAKIESIVESALNKLGW